MSHIEGVLTGLSRFALYSKVGTVTVNPVPGTKMTTLFGSSQYAGRYAGVETLLEPSKPDVSSQGVRSRAHFPLLHPVPHHHVCLARCSEYGYAAAGLEVRDLPCQHRTLILLEHSMAKNTGAET